MPRLRRCAFVLLTALAWTSTPALAQGATFSGEVAYRTHYLFAGIPFSSGGVTQATLSMSAGAFTLNGFASYDHDLSDLNEADVYGDVYVQLSPRIGGFAGVGIYNFEFEAGWETTPEIYAGVVLSAPFSPTVTVAHDLDLGDGTHVLLTLSRSVPLGESGATLDFVGDLDYNDGYWVDVSGFSFADVGVSVAIPLGRLTISPMALAQFGIDDQFVDEEVLGVRASWTF